MDIKNITIGPKQSNNLIVNKGLSDEKIIPYSYADDMIDMKDGDELDFYKEVLEFSKNNALTPADLEDSVLYQELYKVANFKREEVKDILAKRTMSLDKETSYIIREKLSKIISDNLDPDLVASATEAIKPLADLKGVTVLEFANFTLAKSEEVRNDRDILFMQIDTIENIIDTYIVNGDLSIAKDTIRILRTITGDDFTSLTTNLSSFINTHI